MKIRILALTAIVMCIASLAAAQSKETNRAETWDLSVQTRYTAETDYSNSNGASLSLSDDLGWGFGFDYNMNEKVSLGLLIAWRSINYNATYTDATDPTDIGYYGGELDTGTFAAMGQWNILPKTLTPYANAAIGWTLVDTNIVADYQVGCWYDPWWGYVCNGYESTYGSDGVSYALGAGIRWEPKDSVYIQIGYEADWLDLDNVDQYNIFRVDLGFMNN